MSPVQVDEKAVFNAARAIGDAGERERYLEAACRGDAPALARIRELLRAHGQGGGFLESPAVPPEPPVESAGAVIGPYKLLEQIGEGGFGVVFMAEQTQPVRRRVALKVLKPGMDTKQVIGRFEAERQALALMDHPNIARVLDAGTTGTGRPFFVMELVKGIPITEYCDAHHLTPRQRLELFVTVCHAVQHAHQKGIIHRDLKPTNVLVAPHDDRPVAKVIDFGIAKATSGPLTDKTVFTAFAQMIGTPLYMSPEQASMNALDVDTRSDVYSLGVLLYELLTGATPFDKARLKDAAFDEVRRIIREEEPQRPSTRLSTAETLPSVAANRGTEPAKLTRLVRGELDWIAMKALEKERTRRYETANALAMDVQRYLADEAVLACPPSVGYRLRKLARRNRRAVAVGAFAGAMLLVVAASLGWMARDGAARRVRNAEAVEVLLEQCEEALKAEAADRAAIALEAAERRAADGGAKALDGRLERCRADLEVLRELDAVDIFAWTATKDGAPSYQAVAARRRSALAGHGITPEGRAEDVGGRVKASLVRDRIVSALDQWLVVEPSAGLGAVLRAADPDPYRDAVRDAVAARDLPALALAASRPEALLQPPWFALLLGRLKDVPVDRKRELLEHAVRSRPGDIALLMALGALSEAASEQVRWYQAAVAAHPRNSAARDRLASALFDGGDFAGAVACGDEAIRLAPTYAALHFNQGNRFFDKDDPDRAIACYEEAIRLDPKHASFRANLGAALIEKGDMDRAIACVEEAIRLDPHDAVPHGILGAALTNKGQLDRAITCCKEAIRLDPNHAKAHGNLGCVWTKKGEFDLAIASFKEAIRLDPNDAVPQYNLGIAFVNKGEPDLAIASFEEAIRLDPKHSPSRQDLGRAYSRKGDPDRAIACLREAIRLDPTDAENHRGLGVVFCDYKRDPDRAIVCFEEAIRLDPTNATAYQNLGVAYSVKGELDKSIASLEQAIRLGGESTASAQAVLGYMLFKKGELDRAIPCLKEAIRLDPSVASVHLDLGKVFLAKADPVRAIPFFEKAIELDPNEPVAHAQLGIALYQKGGALERAVACYEKALQIDPNCAEAHANLGVVYCDVWRDADKAIACFEKAIQLAPPHAHNYTNLGNAFVLKGDPDSAIVWYEKAIALDPSCAGAHYGLGNACFIKGDLDKSVAGVEKAIALDPDNPQYRRALETARATRRSLQAFETRLPQVLANGTASPSELVWLADACVRYKKRNADAVLLYSRAFAADPSLAEEHRYNAACAAARAADGKDAGAGGPGPSEKARLRGMALEWLNADLAATRKRLADDPASAVRVQPTLRHWLRDPDLGGVRDAAELAKLPDDERELWTKFWSEVRDLVATPPKNE